MAIIKKFRIKSFKKKKSIISFKKIALSFGDRRVLNEISFEINHGEILGILGPNGVGKSTIFNLMTGLIKPNSGEILFENKNITNLPMYLRTKKFNIGFVPQHGGFFHDLTLFENLNAIAEIIINIQRERLPKINYLISKFELDSVRDVKAKFLSGGQKRKLVIALALIGNPRIILMDEPFSALDLISIQMLKEIIINLQTENKISIIIADHQARDLLTCVDTAIILHNTNIVASGTPNELMNNKQARRAYFGESFKFN
tara:strand:- start:71 stop:847 length:777 start_codon:yes stop_codon:yes gene_type:complete